MLLASINGWEILAVLVYLAITAFLGWLGWRHTRSASDYMLAGRRTNPFIMALSYGSTFISTSAIVGFGGVAGQFGMSLLWLVFLNIFVGIFLAFVFLGAPTRRMGQRLDAHTFPELLGRRFQSKAIQVFVGSIIFLFMPLYAAAVIIGGCKFFGAIFGIDYNVALLIFAFIVAIYVFYGGMKGVMYTDAFQGAIMIGGMLILLIAGYYMVGGVTEGHRTLSDLKPLSGSAPMGWTAMPEFGWGDGKKFGLWWTVVTTITMGVGIGVLAQPQLVVRFMTVKSRKDLNRAVILGGLFILLIPGTAYVIGSLSNAYFSKQGPLLSGIVTPLPTTDGKLLMEQKGFARMKVESVESSKLDDDLKIVGRQVDVVLQRDADGAFAHPGGDPKVFAGRGVAAAYTSKAGIDPKTGLSTLMSDPEETIPRYIKMAMPKWFGVLFLLTLLAAAMSTLSGQFHALGTSIGRDIYEQLAAPRPEVRGRTMHVVRVGILIGIVLAALISWWANDKAIDKLIMRGTAIFFGLCTSSFLTAFMGALFFKRMTKAGAFASMIVGFAITAFWLIFVNAKTAADIGLLARMHIVPPGAAMSILWQWENWPEVDPIVVAFPLSIMTAIVVSIFTKAPDKDHVEHCFAPEESQKQLGAAGSIL